MALRACFLTAWLALAACSSAPTAERDRSTGGVTPAATSGQGSLVGPVGSEGESGSEAGMEASGRPGGIGRFGGQTGGEAGIRCNDDVELEPLDFDAVSAGGYSAADILRGLAPSYSATLTYADESTSALTVTLASDGGGAAYAPGCSRNEIDVVVGWSTSDGAFAETLHGKLFALSPEAATLTLELPAANFTGSYASSHSAELSPPPISFSFQFEFHATDAHGSVSALRGPADSQDSLAIGSF